MGVTLSYHPILGFDGVPVPQSALSTSGLTAGTGLARTSPVAQTDPNIDFTSVSGHGQLLFGTTYQWTGYVYVPIADTYTFRLQFTVPRYANTTRPECTGNFTPTFSLATAAGIGGALAPLPLAATGSTVDGIASNPTHAGYTERDLAELRHGADRGSDPRLSQVADRLRDDPQPRPGRLRAARAGHSRPEPALRVQPGGR